MKTALSRADVLQRVGEKLQSRYGNDPIPPGIIRQEASEISGYAESSILPSDFCYNNINADPVSMTDPMFLKVGAGLYRYLGRNYAYSGPILWKPKGEPERIVGTWINGKCNLTHDPRQNSSTAAPKISQATRRSSSASNPVNSGEIRSAAAYGAGVTVPRENWIAYDVLWERIESQLSQGVPDWKQRIERMNQVAAVQRRADGYAWSDDEVFKGLVLSILSSNTDWAKIELVVPELDSIFCNFRLREYSAVKPDYVTQQIAPWFESRRAGSQTLRKSLTALIEAAGKLVAISEKQSSLEHHFKMLVEQTSSDIPSVAIALGGKSSPHKLPGVGVALAAEFLKNIGFDVAKPDRHINRAAGSFGWVTFKNWPNREGTKPPTASELELIAVMREMAKFASALMLPVCYVDNAVWLLCAKSGLHLDNKALSGLIASDNLGSRFR